MRNNTPQVPGCTIQRTNGEFCDAPPYSILSFPVCKKHAMEIFTDMYSMVAAVRNGPPSEHMEISRRHEARNKTHEENMRKQSVVYYIRFPEYIKIGTTTNMRQRLTALRVDERSILATEPGGFDLEKKRHEQFAHLRIGRRENFRLESKFIHHIEAVRNFHGDPVVTDWKTGRRINDLAGAGQRRRGTLS